MIRAIGFLTLFVPMCLRAQTEPISIPGKLAVSVEGFLLIPVTINEHRFWCNPDSGGSNVLSLDEKKGAAAGFKADSSGASAGAGPNIVRDQRMTGATVQIGTVTLRNLTIVMRPYQGVPEMDCILGTGLLRNYTVEFDYTAPQLRLHEPSSYVPDPRAVSIPFHLDRNNPISDIVIDFGDGMNGTASVVLDTGAGFYSAVLMPAAVERLHASSRQLKAAKRPDRPRGTGGELSIQSVRPASIQVGSATVKKPILGLVETPSAGVPWDGLLGTGFFSQFTSTFDYTKGQLFLVTNERFGAPQSFDASGAGFDLDPTARTYAVNMILPASPAAEADLREGDELVTIDGQDASQLNPIEISRLLSAAGKTRELIIRRTGTARTVVLRLRERL